MRRIGGISAESAGLPPIRRTFASMRPALYSWTHVVHMRVQGAPIRHTLGSAQPSPLGRLQSALEGILRDAGVLADAK